MICDQDLREKMDILVKLLLWLSIIVMSMMKLLIKTFVIKTFARINALKKEYSNFLCDFLYSKSDIALRKPQNIFPQKT